MLDLALDLQSVDKLIQETVDAQSPRDRGELARLLFERGLDAWAAYRNAEANLTANSDSDIKDGANHLQHALDEWLDYVAARYLGIRLEQIEGSCTTEATTIPERRYQSFRCELALFRTGLDEYRVCPKSLL
jgi:hypothetical protein